MLQKEQLRKIKISNVYDISIFGMDFNIAIRIFLYGMGFVFGLPGLIKHTILFFWTEQKYIAFYDHLPFEVAESIRSYSIFTGLIMIIFTYVFFNLFPYFDKKPEGVIESDRIVKKIINNGKCVRAKVEKADTFGLSIKGKQKPSKLFVFTANEFDVAKFATLDICLKLNNQEFVYWHPKYPKLAIPAVLIN